jgi:hypothetical protein
MTRGWIARQLDRLPWLCWARLSHWALGRGHLWEAFKMDDCRELRRECGACYCGKLNNLRGEPPQTGK